jgi:hypothetical protein
MLLLLSCAAKFPLLDVPNKPFGVAQKPFAGFRKKMFSILLPIPGEIFCQLLYPDLLYCYQSHRQVARLNYRLVEGNSRKPGTSFVSLSLT